MFTFSRFLEFPLVQKSRAKKNGVNVVTLGGGTGLSTLLSGLKTLVPGTIKRLSAIVTVSDDGGSTGRIIRQHKGIPALGDVRHCILALAKDDALRKLFEYRFKSGKDLKGHSVGNIILTALTEINGDFLSAIRSLSKLLNIKGEVLPSLTTPVVLVAKFSNGKTIKGEVNIANYGRELKGHIVDLWLEAPHLGNSHKKSVYKLKPDPIVIKRIKASDYIIIGPGSLYTSLMPNLLVEDIRNAIMQSRAKKIYIANLMTQFGETYNFSVADHLNAFKEILGNNIFDIIVVNNNIPDSRLLKPYEKEKASPVKYDLKTLQKMGLQIIKADLVYLDKDNTIRHNPYKLAQIIKNDIITN